MRVAAALLVLLAPSMARAEEDFGPYKWSLSPMLGTHRPAIKDLNQRAFRAPFLAEGDVCVAGCEGNSPTNEKHRMQYDNDLDAIGTAANAGLEFQWVQSAKHSFIMGVSTWEGGSSNAMATQLPVQNAVRDVDYIRRADLSYNEFYFGWRYTLWAKPGSYRWYSRMSLNEIFDIDYREEHVFNIKGGELDGVKRIIIANAQTTGVLMLQLGLGGEYFIKRNMSVGFEGGYLFSQRAFTFNSVQPQTNFGTGDNVQTVPPTRPANQGAPLGHLNPDVTADQYFDTPRDDFSNDRDVWISDIRLRLDGWKAAFRFTVYY
jgi:hypothetical protein